MKSSSLWLLKQLDVPLQHPISSRRLDGLDEQPLMRVRVARVRALLDFARGLLHNVVAKRRPMLSELIAASAVYAYTLESERVQIYYQQGRLERTYCSSAAIKLRISGHSRVVCLSL